MPSKPKALTEVQFLALLDKVLGKIMSDLNLRAAIQDEVAKEIRVINNLASFTKFAEKGSVPDVGPETITQLQDQIAATFGGDARVEVTADEKNGGALGVEITLPDRTVSSQIKVDPNRVAEDDGQPKAPFVPFPVALPSDAELVWVLARREDLGPDEAARALASIEEEFWSSKSGQKQLREGAERRFADFIANVPSAALLESGLKRHYKAPETLHSLRLLNPAAAGEEPTKPAAKSRPAAPADNDLDHLFAPAGDEKAAPARARQSADEEASDPRETDEDDDTPPWA